ncbi:hypothetical protein ACOACO_15705 [Nocardioides sp. CPCC 205120]|uniref:hypothetical protein n=1 Tax=Nocardioides sp. CPCC 205120 TaxID=3406462 RepID=UPI003B504903
MTGQETIVLGPLPDRHRRVLAITVVVLFVLAGVVAGLSSTFPVLLKPAVCLGTATGVAAAYLLVRSTSRG